ncbi:sentrin-specific protease 2-like [Mytilus trossulus]|uniref:sentrin-specific protease 2-like n=1 Tax=Mytilus trossulus TaxID=6551 RepID=UPI0030078CF2
MEDDDFKESQPKKMCTEHSSPDAGVSTSIEDDSLSTNEIDRQKAAIKIAKIWEDQIAPWSHYFIAKVYGTSITYGDIYSLKKNSWVTDKIMDAYLELVANREMANGIKIKHMLVTTTNNILNGEYVPARNDKNILMSTEFIIGAYHQSGSHWDLLIIEPLNGRIIFLNPMGETDFQMRTVPLRWKKFIEQLLLQFPADAAVIDKEWNLEVPTHSKQQDGSSCGIYCLMFADKYLARTSLHITPAESNQKRKSIARSLMMFEGYMEGCCPCCGYHTNPVAEPLVKCITCCKFFHKKSHCVGENVDQLNLTEFTCALDRV